MSLDWDERGWGFLAPCGPSRTDFFLEYGAKDETVMGQKLITSRLALVRQYVRDDEPIIDVGIGGGGFVCSRENTFGMDVDPRAIEWLLEQQRSVPQYLRAHALCFWDSFEHIEDPRKLLEEHEPRFVFMSIPIFARRDDAISSKHYKPGEHLWYFTHRGLLTYMERLGYEQMHFSRAEEIIGREGIGTLAFASRGEAERMRCPQS